MMSLLQARTVLGWFRHLQAAGISAEQVEMVTRPESHALLDTIGGVKGESVAARAAEVEKAEASSYCDGSEATRTSSWLDSSAAKNSGRSRTTKCIGL